jgi:methionyl-tRNA formyltransferase
MENRKKILIFSSKKNLRIIKRKLDLYKKRFILRFVSDEKKILKSDMLISFVNGRIFNKIILNKFKYSINFHPGPPNLPGRDPHHWAIFFKKKYYGITLHEMKKKVDTGKIIYTSLFKIKKNDNPQTLRKKAFNLCLNIFVKNFSKIIKGNIKQKKKIIWSKKIRKRSEVYKLLDDMKYFHVSRQLKVKTAFGDFIKN